MESVIREAAEAPAPAAPARVNGSPTITLSHLPKREPVEVKFQDLNYTVSLGFRKGELPSSRTTPRMACAGGPRRWEGSSRRSSVARTFALLGREVRGHCCVARLPPVLRAFPA